MREAMFYSSLDDNRVQCRLCKHFCKIADGQRGLCGVRENRAGVLYSLVNGQAVASGRMQSSEPKAAATNGVQPSNPTPVSTSGPAAKPSDRTVP